jgi:hypothetical protein
MTKNKDFIYYLTIFVSIICAIITYKLSTSISDGYKLIFLIPTVTLPHNVACGEICTKSSK